MSLAAMGKRGTVTGKKYSESEKLEYYKRGQSHHFFGKRHSEESRKKIRDGVKNGAHLEAASKRMKEMNAARRGIKTGPKSEDTKRKISAAKRGKKTGPRATPSPLRGIPRTQEVKHKISQANTGKIRTDEMRLQASKAKDHLKNSVLCLETGETYESYAAAGKALNIRSSSVGKAVKSGKRFNKTFSFKRVA
jgi:hypothetical protein